MLRRVARALRTLLFVLGTMLLVWLPVSFYRGLFLSYSGDRAVDFIIETGSISTSWFLPVTGGPLVSGMPGWAVWLEPGWYLRVFYPLGVDLRSADALPFFYRESNSVGSTQYHVRVPLWLLSAICLAWPVTSFIVHRRRRKRGFPIEPAETPHGATPEK